MSLAGTGVGPRSGGSGDGKTLMERVNQINNALQTPVLKQQVGSWINQKETLHSVVVQFWGVCSDSVRLFWTEADTHRITPPAVTEGDSSNANDLRRAMVIAAMSDLSPLAWGFADGTCPELIAWRKTYAEEGDGVGDDASAPAENDGQNGDTQADEDEASTAHTTEAEASPESEVELRRVSAMFLDLFARVVNRTENMSDSFGFASMRQELVTNGVADPAFALRSVKLLRSLVLVQFFSNFALLFQNLVCEDDDEDEAVSDTPCVVGA
eukprot:TRINITY_DN15180_c0_g1_i1.p1 TRINITY_DN15180_c0_g1~~TRINITY_DN15180_c0_g1_i1.p1  ORF type:complete len:269 (+),score=65.35 TRINITY_DN15180_c0_g1_i1:200-1006(+)